MESNEYNLKTALEQTAEETEHWEDPMFFYVKKNGKTKKYKKK